MPACAGVCRVPLGDGVRDVMAIADKRKRPASLRRRPRGLTVDQPREDHLSFFVFAKKASDEMQDQVTMTGGGPAARQSVDRSRVWPRYAVPPLPDCTGLWKLFS